MSCNIFGQISNNAEIIIGYGTIEKIEGLLCYDNDELILLPWGKISEVVTCKLKYKNENLIKSNNFSLKLENGQYIASNVVNYEHECLTSLGFETYFSFQESAIDNTTRSFLLSGVPTQLNTIIGEINYRVMWKTPENFHSEIIFLPITWYGELNCQKNENIDKTIKLLQRNYCKAYSEKDWCENSISYAEKCGEGLGKCNDLRHICYLINDNFICRYPQENTLEQYYYWSSILSVMLVYFIVALFYFSKR